MIVNGDEKVVYGGVKIVGDGRREDDGIRVLLHVKLGRGFLMNVTIDLCFSHLLLEKQTKGTRRIFKILQLQWSMELRSQQFFRCQNTYRTTKSLRLGRSRWEKVNGRSLVSREWNHKKQIFEKEPPPNTITESQIVQELYLFFAPERPLETHKPGSRSGSIYFIPG